MGCERNCAENCIDDHRDRWNADPDAYSHSNADAYSNTYAHSHSDTNAHTNPYADTVRMHCRDHGDKHLLADTRHYSGIAGARDSGGQVIGRPDHLNADLR